MNDYLVLSRGQWDDDKSPQAIQTAIDEFYTWYESLLQEGRIKPGQRLATEGKWVSKSAITDGPFSETKEIIGGYWIIVAASLAAENPTVACGLTFEVPPSKADGPAPTTLPTRHRSSERGRPTRPTSLTTTRYCHPRRAAWC